MQQLDVSSCSRESQSHGEVVNIQYEHHLIDGDPPGSIVRFAESDKFDLIVVGTHGRTGLTRASMVSVAEAVVHRAPCPVMTYKPAVADIMKV